MSCYNKLYKLKIYLKIIFIKDGIINKYEWYDNMLGNGLTISRLFQKYFQTIIVILSIILNNFFNT